MEMNTLWGSGSQWGEDPTQSWGEGFLVNLARALLSSPWEVQGGDSGTHVWGGEFTSQVPSIEGRSASCPPPVSDYLGPSSPLPLLPHSDLPPPDPAPLISLTVKLHHLT